MCRWFAYHGSSFPIAETLFAAHHSLIDQSLHSREGAEATNGDGFGLGWYTDVTDAPGVFRSIEPAWNDSNLRELATHIRSHLYFAHIRAAIGSDVQRSNCHPFRNGRWLFMHNGYVEGFDRIKRDLMLAMDPEQFALVGGSTDSEVIFRLALSRGLTTDPIGAIEAAIGEVEAAADAHGIVDAVQLSCAVTDGERTWAIRYSTCGNSRTLYVSEDVETVRRLYPDHTRLRDAPDDMRIITSEPIGDLPGAWRKVEESTAVIVSRSSLEHVPFRPKVLAAAAH